MMYDMDLSDCVFALDVEGNLMALYRSGLEQG